MMYVKSCVCTNYLKGVFCTEYLNISLNAIEIVENLAGCENLKKLGERNLFPVNLSISYILFQSSSARNLGNYKMP